MSKENTTPIQDYKRTKIIATVGPSTHSAEAVKKLINSGANGIRLNFSHGDHEEHGERIPWVRKASKELGKPVAIIQDLQGPKIRLGDFEGEITLSKGQNIVLEYKADYEASGHIPVQYDISKKIKRGERLYMFDGKVRATVSSVRDGKVYATVENSGYIVKRKGLNLPDTDFGGDIITAKDKADVAFGATQDIDYVALSFVQHADDIKSLRRMLNNHNSKAKIIAKIETNAAIENIESIIDEADAIMVARGDLAIETLAEAVPIVQRNIIGLCRAKSKVSIVATQMLASMTSAPEPTRAEVSDIATAVVVGADCVMLSDETASGDYPVEAVQFMKRVVLYTEKNSPVEAVFKLGDDVVHDVKTAITSAVLTLANEIDATAIVAETKSGATALNIAARRPSRPVIAVTSDQRVANQLALTYSVKSYVRRDSKTAATKITNFLVKSNVLSKGDTVVSASGKYPGVVGSTDTIKVRVL